VLPGCEDILRQSQRLSVALDKFYFIERGTGGKSKLLSGLAVKVGVGEYSTAGSASGMELIGDSIVY
jgi:hypothetical protein